MNPLTQIKQIAKLNEKELELGVSQKSSWHQQYKNSAYVYIGGLPYDLSEGDIICVFSQYGEVIDINLVRDQKTGKSHGYCFLCYEDQRSTVLAVDNFNGIKLLGRTIKVDHVSDYRRPKEYETDDKEVQSLRAHGVAPTAPFVAQAHTDRKGELSDSTHSDNLKSLNDTDRHNDHKIKKKRTHMEKPCKDSPERDDKYIQKQYDRIKQEVKVEKDESSQSYPKMHKGRESNRPSGTHEKKHHTSSDRTREERSRYKREDRYHSRQSRSRSSSPYSDWKHSRRK